MGTGSIHHDPPGWRMMQGASWFEAFGVNVAECA
jgi:hypothetical protein